jgi:signal transduction histidine kinase
VTPREIDITLICQSAIEDAGATHPASKFELHVHGDLTGLYDEIRLHQLFTNLLVNAAQYGEKKSAIIMDARGDADAITVSVTNDGPAIPEASLETMFQPLIQLPIDDEKEVRPKTSLGLGLFVAREIAMAHGGTIAVKSKDIEGTTFSVCLPRNAARSPSITPTAVGTRCM